MQNEFELIQSDLILAKVIDSLGLVKKWSKQGGRKLQMADALVMLKNRLELRPVRCTSLVEIRLTSENPEEAAEISNTVAEEYRNYRVTGDRTGHSTEIVDTATPPRVRVTPDRIPALCWFGLTVALGFAGICTLRTRTGATN
jgi:uncharacterized protein involved in exopolysaccharide biosynthesis